MDLKDLLLTPFYLMFVYFLAFLIRRRITNPLLRSYFLPALSVKIIGALALGLIYQFYYKGGDTFNFFNDSKAIWQAFLDSPPTAFRIIFASVGDYSPDLYEYTRKIYFFSAGDAQTFHVIRLSGFIGLFTFHTYAINAIFFAVLSFTGLWAMYKTLYTMFPKLHRPLAYAVFFIPSVYFWGSGLMKDSIALGALGWAFYGFYFGFIKRQKVIRNILILLISIIIIRAVKIYIIQCFLPAAILWLFLQYRANIKSRTLRVLSLPFFIALSIPFGYLAIVQISAENKRYQIENLAATTQETALWLETVSEKQGGAGYSLGNFDGTLAGMLSKSPQAVWVGLFQPHIWQAGLNPVRLLASLEATFLLIFTIRVLLQTGFMRLYNIFSKNPILVFCLIFSLIFAFGVAMASYNYGTLVRYRIPLMPFYLAMLYITRFLLTKSVKLF